MTLPHGLRLRDADPDDLPAIAALRAAAGWSVHEWALRAVIGVPHARCVVAEDDVGAVVAVGSGIAYGPLGFVGNMIVAEGHRRRGLGSAILDSVASFLRAAGCRRLELNATAEGRPLYERHGFESIGTSASARIPRGARLTRDPAVSACHATPDDLDALAAYDRPRFGGDRRMLLGLLLEDRGTRFVVAEREAAIAGYACVRPDEPRIGPVLADAPSIAETLLLEAFALAPGADELRLNLPPNNVPGSEWLAGLGVEIEPWDGRMARGPQIERRDETVYGMVVGALG